MIRQQIAEFINRAAHSFLRGVIAHAERRADGAEIALLEIAEHHRVAIFVSEFIDGVVEEGRDFLPVFVGVVV